jgi:nucleoside-diphosphate-sugar epimerase
VSPKAKPLITGAAGEVGGVLTKNLQDQYDLVLTDRRQPAVLCSLPFIEADITDLESMHTACRGIDVVVHLADDRRLEAPWESLLPNNIIGV